MNEILEGVNWLATIVGFFASFALGWLWYSPILFVKKWAEGVGVDIDSKEMPKAAMAAQALATFLLAWIVGITAASNSLLTVLLVILCLAIFIVSNGLYVKKSNAAVFIESSYILAMGFVMILCQGLL